MVSRERPLFVGITETHLADTGAVPNEALAIDGYRLEGLREDRDPVASRKQKDGGVLMYVCDDREVTDIPTVAKEDL